MRSNRIAVQARQAVQVQGGFNRPAGGRRSVALALSRLKRRRSQWQAIQRVLHRSHADTALE
jgi:hypothetical protein